MATCFNTFAWKIPWTMEPGELQSVGSQRVGPEHAGNMVLLPYLLYPAAAAAAKSLQSCPTLCNSMGCRGSSVHEILQASIVEWVNSSYSRGSS